MHSMLIDIYLGDNWITERGGGSYRDAGEL